MACDPRARGLQLRDVRLLLAVGTIQARQKGLVLYTTNRMSDALIGVVQVIRIEVVVVQLSMVRVVAIALRGTPEKGIVATKVEDAIVVPDAGGQRRKAERIRAVDSAPTTLRLKKIASR